MTTNTVEKPPTKSRLLGKDPKSAEPSKPKVLVYGKPGAGKTFTAMDWPFVYYFDTEAGGDLSHYIEKLAKAKGVYLGPADGTLDFDFIIDQVKALATEKHLYKTLVIDSITKVYNTAIAAEAERLGDKNAFGADKKPAIAKMRQLINWISRLDMNVIFIAHEKVMWANGEQAGQTFDCWDKLEYELHLCLQIRKQGDSRTAFVKKSRLIGFPDATSFPWSYEEFAKRYGKDIIERVGQTISLASIDQVLELKKLVETVRVPDDDVEKWKNKAGVSSFEEMDSETVLKCINYLKNKIK